VFRAYFQQQDNKVSKDRFFQHLNELKLWKNVTPFEIMGLVSELNLQIDSHALCTLLLRKSHSLTYINGNAISEYLIPSLKAKYLREEQMTDVPKLNNQKHIAFSIEKPYEDMTIDERNQLWQQFILKLADFLYATNSTIQMIMLPKIFDRVFDGKEYRLLKYRHFIRLIKRKGLGLWYNDEQCIINLIQEILPGNIDVTGIEVLLTKIGIEDEKPRSSKHLDYSKITGPTIRIFNSLNHNMNKLGQEDLTDFLEEKNLGFIDAEIGGHTQKLLVIDQIKLRKVLQEKMIINYGQDLDEDFIGKFIIII
jgi:hypothetical protein